jgi:hypothetical protein
MKAKVALSMAANYLFLRILKQPPYVEVFVLYNLGWHTPSRLRCRIMMTLRQGAGNGCNPANADTDAAVNLRSP